jgi:hypothetical protein
LKATVDPLQLIAKKIAEPTSIATRTNGVILRMKAASGLTASA